MVNVKIARIVYVGHTEKFNIVFAFCVLTFKISLFYENHSSAK